MKITEKMRQEYSLQNSKEAMYLRKQPEILDVVQLAATQSLTKDFSFVGE